MSGFREREVFRVDSSGTVIGRGGYLLHGYRSFVGTVGSAHPPVPMLPCGGCGQAHPSVSWRSHPQVTGDLCDACFHRVAGFPVQVAPGAVPPLLICDQCGIVQASVSRRPVARGILTPNRFCDTCWNTVGPCAPSPGAVLQNRPAPITNGGSFVGMMPKLFGTGIAEKIAETPHCGQCAHCCNGLIEGCESYAPELPCEVTYTLRGSAYVLQLTGAWVEVSAIRLYRVQLPEGEQVPCGFPGCRAWFATGWGSKRLEGHGYGYCDECGMSDLTVTGRSR